jgi:polysaccharide export outer membrane protein
MNVTLQIFGSLVEPWRAATRRGSTVLVLFACLLTAACQSTGTTSNAGLQTSSIQPQAAGIGNLTMVSALAEPKQVGNSDHVKISQNDLLKVDVFQVDDLDRTVRVDSTGMISLPLVGQIRAAGSTGPELERTLEKRYGAKYLQSPEITVFVEESYGQRVTMDGEFNKPGIYPISGNSTLLQVVAQAGGLTRLADEGKIYVYRQQGGGQHVANYSIAGIRSGKMANPQLHGGDVVVSFTSGSKVAMENLRQALGLAVSATRVMTPF